jgi:hypothetical protein
MIFFVIVECHFDLRRRKSSQTLEPDVSTLDRCKVRGADDICLFVSNLDGFMSNPSWVDEKLSRDLPNIRAQGESQQGWLYPFSRLLREDSA